MFVLLKSFLILSFRARPLPVFSSILIPKSLPRSCRTRTLSSVSASTFQSPPPSVSPETPTPIPPSLTLSVGSFVPLIFRVSCFFSKNLVEELRELPRVRWVLSVDFIHGEDRYYGGDLFVDGNVIHRPPQDSYYDIRDLFVDENVIHRPPQHSVGELADYDLWVIKFKSPRNIDFYVKFLACLVGSEEEAKRRIYALKGYLL